MFLISDRPHQVSVQLASRMALGILMVLGSLSSPMLLPSSTPALAQTIGLPQTVDRRVKQDITKKFQAPLNSLRIANFSQQSWPDGCFGLPKASEVCTQAIVEGWRVAVTDGSQLYVYRTDRNGLTLRSENSPQSILPRLVAQRLQQFASAELKIAPRRLQIKAINPRVFDGCLGIFQPNRACTKIGIRGWQVVISTGQRSWLYHINQNAQRIVQNSTASNALAPVDISFAQLDAALKSEIIFTSSTSGDLSGRTVINTLSTDGKVTRLVTAPNIRSRPVLLRTLTPAQVSRFKEQLMQQRFPNLDGLQYLSPASLADAPTTTLQTQGSMVNYTSVEKDQLPVALRRVINIWETISKSN